MSKRIIESSEDHRNIKNLDISCPQCGSTHIDKGDEQTKCGGFLNLRIKKSIIFRCLDCKCLYEVDYKLRI